MTTPYPWQPQPGDPRPPEPTPPPPGIDQATRSPIAMAVAAALIVFAALLFTATPASAHGGSAPCPVSGARVASWGCGTAHTYSTGGRRVAEAWIADTLTDGRCVRARTKSNASRGWFNVGDRACDLGVRDHVVLSLNLSAEFHTVRLYRDDGRYLTLCGTGSGRTC